MGPRPSEDITNKPSKTTPDLSVLDRQPASAHTLTHMHTHTHSERLVLSFGGGSSSAVSNYAYFDEAIFRGSRQLRTTVEDSGAPL